jgi:hypothetical protein
VETWVERNIPTIGEIGKRTFAENVVKKNYPGGVEWLFDFLCPNCGQRHKGKEITMNPIFAWVRYTLRCGDVKVWMPWKTR